MPPSLLKVSQLCQAMRDSLRIDVDEESDQFVVAWEDERGDAHAIPVWCFESEVAKLEEGETKQILLGVTETIQSIRKKMPENRRR